VGEFCTDLRFCELPITALCEVLVCLKNLCIFMTYSKLALEWNPIWLSILCKTPRRRSDSIAPIPLIGFRNGDVRHAAGSIPEPAGAEPYFIGFDIVPLFERRLAKKV
jgi:hypothetical protein